MTRSLSWTTGSGFWSQASNWDDLTTPSNPALMPPGSTDVASIQGPAFPAFDLVGGPGAAGTVETMSNLAFYGTFQFGTLTNGLNNLGGAADSGAVDVMPFSVVTAGSVLAQ